MQQMHFTPLKNMAQKMCTLKSWEHKKNFVEKILLELIPPLFEFLKRHNS